MRRADREQQLLGAAEAVFAERGFAGATMEEVATRAGVTKPVLYEHFGSKDGLLLACVERARQDLLEATVAAVAIPGDLRTRLRAGVHSFFAFLDEHAGAWSVLVAEALVGGTAAEEVERIRRQQDDALAALLATEVRAAPEVLAAYAALVNGACERMAVWRTGRDPITPDLAAERVMAVVWHGLSHHLLTLGGEVGAVSRGGRPGR